MPDNKAADCVTPRPQHTGRISNSTVTLNIDILCHTLKFIDNPDDLRTTMLTCRALYSASIQPLVRLLSVCNHRTIRPFHDFMLAHSPTSFLAFRECHIEWWGEMSDKIPFLVELLERGTNLKKVELRGFRQGWKEVGEAVISLRNLEELFVQAGSYRITENILTRLQSPLTKVTIFSGTRSQDPTRLLANFQNTLESASITQAGLFSEGFYYPKLVTLELRGSTRPPLSILSTAFPNLKHLILDTREHLEHLSDIRNENIAFRTGRKCWESLISVNADLASLYAMGLKNSLKSLEIAPQFGDLPYAHVSYLRTLISETNIGHLTLGLSDTPGVLSELLSGGFANPLSSFKLTLGVCTEFNHEKSLNNILKELASVVAVKFHLKLRAIESPVQTLIRALDLGHLERPCRAAGYLKSLDKGTLVERVRGYVRNPAYISLEIEDRGITHWMKAEPEKDEWTQVQLNEGAARGGRTPESARRGCLKSAHQKSLCRP